jgi:predicted TIM-barrel fold metal-dependent hydrolase
MAMEGHAGGGALRTRLGHPVVDCDGHFLECFPVLEEYITAQGVSPRATAARGSTPDRAQRAHERLVQRSWWSLPARNTLDHASALLPSLFAERLEQLGIDFSIMFPSAGLMYPQIDEDELRRASCRGLNHYVADVFADLHDRLEPAAAIPMHTPDEALDELDHAVTELGFKTVMIPAFVERPVGIAESAVRAHPEVGVFTTWFDTFGIDSAHDYDPFWARCVELGVSLSAHTPSLGKGLRTSVSNYMFNHIGNFAAANEALCKSLFLGGVTRRFPRLRIAFLEGGVGWAASLLGDLIGHWEKRNAGAVLHYDPAAIDLDLLESLKREHGGTLAGADLGRYRASLPTSADVPDELDDFVACGIEKAADIVELFVPNFYFGCEADDPMTRVAFDGMNPSGATLSAMFSSDVGHWDVRDMGEVLGEAYEMVEDGLISDADFRSFTFEHPVRFHTELNPEFFAATAIAAAVDAERAGPGGP